MGALCSGTGVAEERICERLEQELIYDIHQRDPSDSRQLFIGHKSHNSHPLSIVTKITRKGQITTIYCGERHTHF